MTTGPRDFGRELYPFLHSSGADDSEANAGLLEAVRRSTLDKSADVVALRREMLAEHADALVDAAERMAQRFANGGKLLAFGNGGSATDADDAAGDCMVPPVPGWRPLPALSLPSDSATVTAIGNDVGLESVFVRQIGALAERGDIALAISTSGTSANVLAGLAEAKRRGLLTIALTGYDGGTMARNGDADFCFIARREFVPRIQEGHATLWHVLLELVQQALGARVEVPA